MKQQMRNFFFAIAISFVGTIMVAADTSRNINNNNNNHPMAENYDLMKVSMPGFHKSYQLPQGSIEPILGDVKELKGQFGHQDCEISIKSKKRSSQSTVLFRGMICSGKLDCLFTYVPALKKDLY